MTKKSQKTLVVTLAFVMILSVISGTALAQGNGNNGQSRDTVVANTAANPVPVTGGVAITNVPTVKLDPNENTVSVGRTRTVLLANQYYLATVPTTPDLIIDASEFETIRVCAAFSIGREATLEVDHVHQYPSQGLKYVNLLTYIAPENSGSTGTLSNGICRTVVPPGETLRIRILSLQGSAGLTVWGR